MIKLIMLGTSSMVPTKKRNQVSFFMQTNGLNALFDCGEGTQRQIRIAKIKPSSIDYLFITHWHGDHTLGVPGLLQMLNANNKEKITIIGPKGTSEKIDLILKAFEFRKTIDIEIIEADETPIMIGNFKVVPKYVDHNTITLAYRIEEKEKVKINKKKVKELNIEGPILKKIQNKEDIIVDGKKIKWMDVGHIEKGVSFTYITDTRYRDDLCDFAAESDILVIESTYLNDEKEKAHEFLHLCTEEALKIGESTKEIILTHFSQRYKEDAQREKEIKGHKNCIIAKDFMEVLQKDNKTNVKMILTK